MAKKRIKNLKGFKNGHNIKSQYIVSYSIENNSRYKHIDELLLEDGKIIKSTLGPINLGVLPFDGVETYVVTAAEENRIDIIATKFYGNASLYWIICYANRLSDPYNLPIGTFLEIPNIGALRRFPNPLS